MSIDHLLNLYRGERDAHRQALEREVRSLQGGRSLSGFQRFLVDSVAWESCQPEPDVERIASARQELGLDPREAL